jgi:hypothetical protein
MTINPNLIASISIAARRWFQKSYGNTYHRVHVLIEFKDSTQARKFLDSGIHYGYGDQYQQTAVDLLRAEGVLVGDCWFPLRLWCEQYGIEFYDLVADVNTKRELKEFTGGAQ